MSGKGTTSCIRIKVLRKGPFVSTIRLSLYDCHSGVCICMSTAQFLFVISELNVDNWNDNCEAKSEAKSLRPLRGLQVDFSLTRNVSYAVR